VRIADLPRNMGPQYGDYFTSPFWQLEFGNGFYIFGKFLNPWYKTICNMKGKGVATGISCVNSVVKYKGSSPVTICMIRQNLMFRHPLISSLCNQPSGG
jgi:hypothetical protein